MHRRTSVVDCAIVVVVLLLVLILTAPVWWVLSRLRGERYDASWWEEW
ncbi:MAG: hypothetical protein ABFC80_08115 [Coriobacteriales bacterium]